MSPSLGFRDGSKLTRCSFIPKIFREKAVKGGEEGERKWILRGVEGECRSGEVLAM